jgi:hypothetical protein
MTWGLYIASWRIVPAEDLDNGLGEDMKNKPFKLRDEDIESVGIDRRSFLGKVGVAAAGAVVMTGAAGCFGSDVCDSDRADQVGDESDLADPTEADTDRDSCDED